MGIGLKPSLIPSQASGWPSWRVLSGLSDSSMRGLKWGRNLFAAALLGGSLSWRDSH